MCGHELIAQNFLVLEVQSLLRRHTLMSNTCILYRAVQSWKLSLECDSFIHAEKITNLRNMYDKIAKSSYSD